MQVLSAVADKGDPRAVPAIPNSLEHEEVNVTAVATSATKESLS